MKMNTIWSVLEWLFVGVALLSIGNFKIDFFPFRMGLDRWRVLVGLMLVALGCLLILSHAHRKAYKEGYKKAIQDVRKLINDATPQVTE